MKEIKQIVVICNYEILKKLEPQKIDKVPKKDIEAILSSRYVRPYFQGINRFLEKGSLFEVEKFQFQIHDCKPQSGVVTSHTQITMKILGIGIIYELKKINYSRKCNVMIHGDGLS